VARRAFVIGKKTTGRKRHLIVDTLGLLLVVMVTSATARFPGVALVWADGGYANKSDSSLPGLGRRRNSVAGGDRQAQRRHQVLPGAPAPMGGRRPRRHRKINSLKAESWHALGSDAIEKEVITTTRLWRRPGVHVGRMSRTSVGSLRPFTPHWAVTSSSVSAVSTSSPVPTAKANSLSCTSPASSASATLTASGTVGALVSISSFW
jgi:hypothetical protein